MDLDGCNILPYKQIIVMQGEHTTTLGAEKCNPDEFIITTYETATETLHGGTSKVTVLFKEGVDLEMACKSMALGSEFRFWHSDGKQVFYARMGDIISGKGLPILVPWGIVVLTVIATMLGAMHERKGEINILSSVGLNPAHISTVFMTEALILGILAGGLGYLLGLSWYPIMAEFSLAPDVKQKVSALWSVASIVFSIISVIVGTFFSLRSSVSLTPSLRRRWNASKDITAGKDKYEIPMPIQLNDSTVTEFINFAESELIRRVTLVYGKIGTPQQGFSQVIKRRNELGDTILSFGYTKGGKMDGTINRLQVSQDPGNGEYHVTLNTVGSPKGANDVGLLVRKVVMKWSDMHGRNNQP